MHRLDAPTAIAKLSSHPIEQFGMGRCFALLAEILGSADQSLAEKLLPHAIHGYPRGQRVPSADDPLRQSQAIAWELRGHGRQERWRFGRCFSAMAFVVATDAHVILTRRGIIPQG